MCCRIFLPLFHHLSSMNYAITVASSLLGVAITVPLSGALLRWRVHYAPRRIRLEDSEEQQSAGEQPCFYLARVRDIYYIMVAPPVTGYFSTLRRVYRLEVCHLNVFVPQLD